jgi:hypothetical protein
MSLADSSSRRPVVQLSRKGGVREREIVKTEHSICQVDRQDRGRHIVGGGWRGYQLGPKGGGGEASSSCDEVYGAVYYRSSGPVRSSINKTGTLMLSMGAQDPVALRVH